MSFKIIINNKVLWNKLHHSIGEIHKQLGRFHRFNWYELVEHPHYLIENDQYLDYYVSEIYRLEKDGSDRYKLLAYTDVMHEALSKFAQKRDFKTMDELIKKYLHIHIDLGHIIGIYDDFQYSLDKEGLEHMIYNYFNPTDQEKNIVYQMKRDYPQLDSKEIEIQSLDIPYLLRGLSLDFLNFILEIRKDDLPKNINQMILRCGTIAMIESMFKDTPSYIPPRTVLQQSIVDGNIEIIKTIIKHRPDAYLQCEALEQACLSKKMEVVELINETFGSKLESNTLAMDTAIRNGSLEIVKYLHHNRTEGFSSDAFVKACGNGHIEVAKFLLDNRTEANNIKVDVYNIENRMSNYLEILRFLIERDLHTNINNPNIITMIVLLDYDKNKYSMEEILDYYLQQAIGLNFSDMAFGFGKALKILVSRFEIKQKDISLFIQIFMLSEKILPHGKSIQLSHFLRHALVFATMDIVKFIFEQLKHSPRQLRGANYIQMINYDTDYTVPVQLPQALINYAAASNSMELVKYICESNYTQRGIILYDINNVYLALDSAACHSLEMVVYLHEHNVPYCSTNAMDNAILNNHLDIVEFLHNNRTEGCSKNAMSMAIKSGNVEMVKWLNENRTEEFSITNDEIKHMFSSRSYRVAEYLLESNKFSNEIGTFTHLISYGQLSVIRFIHENKIQTGFTKEMLEQVQKIKFFSIAKYISDVQDWID